MAEMFELAPAGVALLDAPAASLAPTCPSDRRFSLDVPFDAPFSPDPFAEWDPFDLLGPLDRLRDPGEFIDSADIIDIRPPFDTSQFIGTAGSTGAAGSIGTAGSIRTAGSTTSDATIADTSAPPDAMTDLRAALDAAEQAQQAANRAMAAHLGACRAALDAAARNPALYLHPGSLGDRDASELAVRAAATELSMRLHLPVGTIRNRAHEATVLHDRLPACGPASPPERSPTPTRGSRSTRRPGSRPATPASAFSTTPSSTWPATSPPPGSGNGRKRSARASTATNHPHGTLARSPNAA
ncbi:hypothetical protein MUN74_08535 [Agromyces endophyticus]|uniref:hypothetical protein n=1 Tax=Agromyces sp. H17E-10 TaxID=2932244 RepID=UPI001FD39B8E|nr:hypothetical protein [Agromyces sp. H17E-10]UOQ90930.1 hypothetical protein MUN74_08535 [Agromyces sp. H17E-10]